MISIIVPIYNEAHNPYFLKILDQFSKDKGVELIFSDSKSTDGTKEILEKYPVRYLTTDKQSRAARINLAIEACHSDTIIIHHPRALLSPEALSEVKKTKSQWGGFTHRFDHSHFLLKFTSWYSNSIRSDLKSIFYLDHCFYFKKNIYKKIFPIQELDIFEDTEISLKARKICRGKRLRSRCLVSAVRFKINGVFAQVYLNQKMKLFYYFGKDHRKINRNYEKHINLNTDYDT
jgi:glycosyltransferase involved in cell wall biosynthesis